MPKVKCMILFANGNIAAFNEAGEQIGELQRESALELWAYHARSLGYDVDGCEFSVPQQVAGTFHGGKFHVDSDDSVSVHWM